MRVSRRQNREDEFVGELQIERRGYGSRVKNDRGGGLPMAVGDDSLIPFM